MRRIVSNATNVIFISAAHEISLRDKYPSILSSARSVTTIPNGIDKYWFDNRTASNIKRDEKILFVGRFNHNKNIRGIFNAVKLARKSRPNIGLTLVGGTVDQFLSLTKLNRLPEWVEVIDHIADRDRLLKIYRSSSVFLMPSFHETFGLVYIEALSQGCPYIHTTGEGIDYYFKDPFFSRAVAPDDIQSISNAITDLMNCYPFGVEPETVSSMIEDFCWDSIASRYIEITT